MEVARAVNQRLDQLKPAIPADVRLGMVENQADDVIAALRGVRNAAVEASILVIVIIYSFWGQPPSCGGAAGGAHHHDD